MHNFLSLPTFFSIYLCFSLFPPGVAFGGDWRELHVEVGYSGSAVSYNLYKNSVFVCNRPNNSPLECLVELDPTPMAIVVTAVDAADRESPPSTPFLLPPLPQAKFTASVSSGAIPLPVHFDASASSDYAGFITSYTWNFGDGSSGTGAHIDHTFTETGTYAVQLTVVNDAGNVNETTHFIITNSVPASGASSSVTTASVTTSSSTTSSVTTPTVTIQTVIPTDAPNTVYRFYNTERHTHFYTASAEEKNYVLDTLPEFSYEGAAFIAASDESSPSIAPVYRFYNTTTGTHFYTNSESEKGYIIANYPTFIFEGKAYNAYTTSVPGTVGLHRFFNSQTGTHFYTTSEAEKQNIQNTLPSYQYEGIVYYVENSPSE